MHAALLVLGELVSNSGDFMEEYYKEACEVCLKYSKESKQPLVRKAGIHFNGMCVVTFGSDLVVASIGCTFAKAICEGLLKH